MYTVLKTFLSFGLLICLLNYQTNAQSISDFTLVNVNTQQDLGSLFDFDEVLDVAALSNGELDIRALTNPTSIGRVEFIINDTLRGADLSFPYSLQGVSQGTGWTPQAGLVNLLAVAYDSTEGGVAGDSLRVFFEVGEILPPPFRGVVEGFNLFDEDRGAFLQNLEDNAVIDIFSLPTLDLSIQAQVNTSQVKSVRYTLRNLGNTTTNNAIIDGIDEFKWAWTPSPGNFELEAVPFSEALGEGEAGPTFRITFTILNQIPEIVSQIRLLDAESNFVLVPFLDGRILNLNGLSAQNFNIEALSEENSAQRLEFALKGPDTFFRADVDPPYTLIAAPSDSTFFEWMPKVGNYTLTITPFFVNNLDTVAGTSQTFGFSFINESVVSEVTLNDAQNNFALAGLGENDTLDLEDFSSQSFNIQAHVQPFEVGSVAFILEGPDNISRIDNTPPFALIADITDEDFFSWLPKRGNYRLSIITYTQDFGQGRASDTLVIPFTIKEGNAFYFGDVIGFELIDADLDQVIRTFDTRDVIVLPFLPTRNLNLRAITEPANVGSVTFNLTGRQLRNLTDNQAPYAAFGDNFGNYLPWQFPIGEFTLSAAPYSGILGRGTVGKPLTTQFIVTESIGETVRLDLIDADSDQKIGILQDGDRIKLNQLASKNLNILATSEAPFNASVVFELSGSDDAFQVENSRPFSLFGDQNGNNFLGREMLPGKYTLKATPYTKSNGNGDAGKPNIIQFELLEDGNPCESVGLDPNQTPWITGNLREWHRVVLTFDGPCACEADPVNPFLDYWMEVVFVSPNGRDIYRVPGFFAADGNAANSHRTCGNKWRVYFAPDTAGTWSYSALFRAGSGVAVSDDPLSVGSVAAFNGARGTLDIRPTNKQIPDNRARGRLEYVGTNYLQFAGNKEFFIKGGPDSPENFLAYRDFDNTPNNKGYRKSWNPHVQDWREGDPTWQGKNGEVLGKGIIGSLNYLSREKGLNVFSFLTLSMRGAERSDDDNVFPYIRPSGRNQFPPRERLRFDVSKLDQWEIVFKHADELGLYLHFKMQEIENNRLLDQGALGPERKLYIRELIARFGHHLALNWNIGEENNQTTQQQKDMIAYVRQINPYKKAHIVMHTQTTRLSFYDPMLGDQSELTGASFQRCYSQVHEDIKTWLRRAENAGRPWVIASDEQGPATVGVPPDGVNAIPSQGEIRKYALWGSLMAGGAGIEYYFGYEVPCTDLTCQDFRSRDRVWDQTIYALDFFKRYLPYWEMKNADELISNRRVPGDYCRQDRPNSLPRNEVNYCFAKEGAIYVVYLGNGGNTNLNLKNFRGTYEIRFYNPRTGQMNPQTTVRNFNGGSFNVQAPDGQDWAMLITRRGFANINNAEQSFEPIKLFPNPSSEQVNLEIEAQEDCDQGRIILYTQEGLEAIREETFSLKTGKNALELVTKNLPNGYYLYRITTCEGVKDGRFLIKHE